MSDPAPVAVASPAAEKPASPAKKAAKSAAAKPKKPKVPKSHPPVSDMVVNAIKTLNKRGGSSLQAIKKFLAAQYKVDVEKLAPFIKKFLKSTVAKGKLLQTRGKGASGFFKLPAAAKKEDAPEIVAKRNSIKTLMKLMMPNYVDFSVPCDICEESFNTPKQMRQHKNRTHSLAHDRFIYDKCGAKLKRKDKLIQHFTRRICFNAKI